MNLGDAYESGFEAGLRAARADRTWVELTDDEYAQLAVDYAGDDRALMVMTAAKVREKNE